MASKTDVEGIGCLIICGVVLLAVGLWATIGFATGAIALGAGLLVLAIYALRN